jgi:hypothetical protein
MRQGQTEKSWKMGPMSDWSKQWRLSRTAIGVLFTLGAVSLVGAFVTRREMETQSLQHSERWKAMRLELTLCRTLLDQTSAAVDHSRERLRQAEFLIVTEESIAPRTVRDRWHKTSIEGRDAAANDLVSLTKIPPESPRDAQVLLRSVEKILRAEIQVWSEIDMFTRRKGAGQGDKGAFEAIAHALMEHHERERSYANPRSIVVGLSQTGLKESAELEGSAKAALEQSRKKLLWSGLGLAALSFGLPCYCYVQRPRKTIPITNR